MNSSDNLTLLDTMDPVKINREVKKTLRGYVPHKAIYDIPIANVLRGVLPNTNDQEENQQKSVDENEPINRGEHFHGHAINGYSTVKTELSKQINLDEDCDLEN